MGNLLRFEAARNFAALELTQTEAIFTSSDVMLVKVLVWG